MCPRCCVVCVCVQTLHLLIGELLNPRPAPESFKEERLRTALSLSRRMLFELDVTSFSYVSHAHILVLANMWRFRQPAAAVSLVRHALGLHMVNLVHELNGAYCIMIIICGPVVVPACL